MRLSSFAQQKRVRGEGVRCAALRCVHTHRQVTADEYRLFDRLTQLTRVRIGCGFSLCMASCVCAFIDSIYCHVSLRRRHGTHKEGNNLNVNANYLQIFVLFYMIRFFLFILHSIP